MTKREAMQIALGEAELLVTGSANEADVRHLCTVEDGTNASKKVAEAMQKVADRIARWRTRLEQTKK